jgi:hypothetical protein
MEFITINKSQALGEKEKESCDKPHPWCKWSQKGQSTSFCLTIHLEKIKTQQENYQKSSLVTYSIFIKPHQHAMKRHKHTTSEHFVIEIYMKQLLTAA